MNSGRARADNSSISPTAFICFPTLRQATLRKRLWLGAAGVLLFISIVFAARAAMPHRPALGPMGLDFVAFYTAGSAVRDGRAQDLYDLDATNRFQQTLQERQGVAIGHRFAPWWNPPFYSLIFVPFSRLTFHTALLVWSLVSVLCAASACVLLCRMLPPEGGWQSRALVPVLLVLSTPFIATLTHGQNSCMSLALLTVTVVLWRARRPLAAGLAGGLLFYKPQIALVLAAVMLLDLGWRAALGYAITVVILLGLNLLILPGSLTTFLHQLPLNLDVVQSQIGYPWERHVTFKAFWRVLIQGNEAGMTCRLASSLGVACAGMMGALLARTALRARTAGITTSTRDALIAVTIAITPLLMPFYFDYDLLLLAVPMVLLAAQMPKDSETRRESVLIACCMLLYLWLMVNPDVAEHFRINLAVPMLAAVALILLRRANEAVAGTNNRLPELTRRSRSSEAGDWLLPDASL